MNAMKAKTVHIGVTILVLLSMGLLSPVYADTAGINWVSYDKGMVLGKSQQKKVFIKYLLIF